MGERGREAGEAEGSMGEVQYGSPEGFDARVNLNLKYGTARVGWHSWVAQQVVWPESSGAILEVGCGPGWLWGNAAEVLPPGLRLVLTDFSPAMVSEALVRVRAVERYASVEGLDADAQSLPFGDGTFDVVVANHMLYHVPDPARAVAELARVRRPGGVVLAATIGQGHLPTFWEIVSAAFDVDLGHFNAVTAFDSETGRPILEREFERVEARQYEDELHCTDPHDVVAYLRSLPPANQASPAQLDRLVDAVHDRFEQANGTLIVPKDIVMFVCR